MTVNVLETSDSARKSIANLMKEAFKKCLSPPPKLNLVEWADRYRFLPDNSAESGRWKTERVEVARQPMLSVTDPLVQEVTVMCCIQLMKTELMLNTALYYMHQEPSPILYCAPKKDMAEAWSKERLVKSVNATPVVADIFSDNRRGEGNTITQKQFVGGQISIVSARNPADLAMRAVRILLFDECDKYPANAGAGEGGSGGEGDPIAIAWGRATTYGKRAKKITACSPTVDGKSRIQNEYLKSNMCVFNQRCPHCNHCKVLSWLDVKIPRNKNKEFIHNKAVIVCSECGAIWSESDRLKSIREGYWESLRPEITYHHGYKASALVSPFLSVKDLAKEFCNAQSNPEALKAFYNTRMAEPWKEVGEQPDWRRLYENRESYPMKEIPDGALILTAGFDIQKDYFVYEVVGWGRKKESWSIDAGMIQGSIETEEGKIALTNFLDRTYANSKGVMVPIMKACIDSGYNTQEVYSFCRQYGSDRVAPIKGDDRLSSIIGTPRPVDVTIDGKRFSRGIMLWHVGSSVIKEQLYRWLTTKRPTDDELKENNRYPTGYCHFPQYDEEFFKQLTAEQYVKQTDKKGFFKYVWEKTRKDNHYLDCRVYARAASTMLQMDRMIEADWVDLEKIWLPDPSRVDTHVTLNDDGIRRDRMRKGTWIKRR